ncbi:hypothetical protein C8R45DRAFT_938701 [Mycena sanguinolenta]|nr:hypothetical protein C8R45DRAFT_938701 [Mycena sanguinolenta]
MHKATRKAMWDRIHRERQARREVSAGWYTNPNLPEYWSTDWNHWESTCFWFERAQDGKLKIDKLFKETWELPGIIEPLAYMPSTGGLYFLLRYYFYADEKLTVHEASIEFESAEEFMRYVVDDEDAPGSRMPDIEVPPVPGTDLSWCLQAIVEGKTWYSYSFIRSEIGLSLETAQRKPKKINRDSCRIEEQETDQM